MCNMNLSSLVEYDYNMNDYENLTICEKDPIQEVPDGSRVMQVLYYTLFGLGLLGNITVLWVLLQYIKLKSMTDVCLLNLAMSDLILAVSLPLWAYNYPSLASCKMMTGVYQLGFYSGTLFVTLMSVDRYLAIVHAVAAMQARTLHYGIIVSIAIWATAVILASPQVIFATLQIDADDNLQCEPLYPEERQQYWKLQRNFSENTVGLFICLPIMIFCYVKILMVLSKARNSKKGKAVKLIFTIVLVFVVCWVPYNIVVFLQALQLFEILDTCEALKILNSAMGFAEIIALSHCCINPIIYAFVGEKFRKSLCKALSRYFCRSYQSRGAFSHRDTTEKETSNTPVRLDY